MCQGDSFLLEKVAQIKFAKHLHPVMIYYLSSM